MNDADAKQRIIVCQGPPRCSLENEIAVAAALAGCIWCKVITVHSDGTETVEEPTEA